MRLDDIDGLSVDVLIIAFKQLIVFLIKLPRRIVGYICNRQTILRLSASREAHKQHRKQRCAHLSFFYLSARLPRLICFSHDLSCLLSSRLIQTGLFLYCK